MTFSIFHHGIRIRFIKIISVRFLNYIRLNVTYKYITQAYMANTPLHRFVLNIETYFCRQIYTKIEWLKHAEFDYCFCREQVSTNKCHDSFTRYICSTKFCEIWEIKCYTQNNNKKRQKYPNVACIDRSKEYHFIFSFGNVYLYQRGSQKP